MILGVPDFEQSPAVIKQAYKKLARVHHPDKVPHDLPDTVRARKLKEAEEMFKRVGNARDVLMDDDSKAKYDGELRAHRRAWA